MPTGFMPPRNQFDAASTASGPSAATSLDGPPPHAAPRPAGADTNALLGRDPSDTSGDGSGALSMSPKARITAAVAMMMQAVNIIESTLPGAIPPQMIMMVDQLRVQLPAAAQSLSQSASPLGLLSAMGASALTGGMGGQMAPGGQPPVNPASAGSPGMPMMPSIPQSAGIPQRPQQPM